MIQFPAELSYITNRLRLTRGLNCTVNFADYVPFFLLIIIDYTKAHSSLLFRSLLRLPLENEAKCLRWKSNKTYFEGRQKIMFNSTRSRTLMPGNFLQLFIARIDEFGFGKISQLICALMQSGMRSFKWRWRRRGEKVEAMKILKCEELGAVRGFGDMVE